MIGASESNHYCSPCNRHFAHNYLHNRHLASAFHKRMALQKSKTPNAPSDNSEQNAFCNICNKLYASTTVYRSHMQRVHKMDLTTLRRRKVKPDMTTTAGIPSNNSNNNSNYHCMLCSLTFTSRDSYYDHLEKLHRMATTKNQAPILNPSILPDINDPNHYCKSCQVTFNEIDCTVDILQVYIR